MYKIVDTILPLLEILRSRQFRYCKVVFHKNALIFGLYGTHNHYMGDKNIRYVLAVKYCKTSLWMYNYACKYLLASTVVLASSSKISEDILHKLKRILILFPTVLMTSDKSELSRYISASDGHFQFSNSIISSDFLITQTFSGDRGSP